MRRKRFRKDEGGKQCGGGGEGACRSTALLRFVKRKASRRFAYTKQTAKGKGKSELGLTDLRAELDGRRRLRVPPLGDAFAAAAGPAAEQVDGLAHGLERRGRIHLPAPAHCRIASYGCGGGHGALRRHARHGGRPRCSEWSKRRVGQRENSLSVSPLAPVSAPSCPLRHAAPFSAAWGAVN